MAKIPCKQDEDAVFTLFNEVVKELFRQDAIRKIGRIKKGGKVTYYVTVQY